MLRVNEWINDGQCKYISHGLEDGSALTSLACSIGSVTCLNFWAVGPQIAASLRGVPSKKQIKLGSRLILVPFVTHQNVQLKHQKGLNTDMPSSHPRLALPKAHHGARHLEGVVKGCWVDSGAGG